MNDSDGDGIFVDANVNSSKQGIGVEQGAAIDYDDKDQLFINLTEVDSVEYDPDTDTNTILDNPLLVDNASLNIDQLQIGEIVIWTVGYHDANGDIIEMATGTYVGQSSGGSSSASDETLFLKKSIY